MGREGWTKEEQSLANLIYSAESANDILALEAAKKFENLERILPKLLCIWMTTPNSEVRKSFETFLRKKNVLNNFNILLVAPNSDLDIWLLEKSFPKAMLPELFYTHFKRSKSSVEAFLLSDSKEHPCRDEVFNFFFEKHKESGHGYPLLGSSKNEIQKIVTYSKEKNRPRFNEKIVRINLEDLPECEYDNGWLEVKECISNGFPKQLFYFKRLWRLALINFQFEEFPDDMSSLKELTEIRLDNNNLVLKNFKFLSTLPKLKRLILGSNMVYSPNSLMQKKYVPFVGQVRFQFLEQFEGQKFPFQSFAFASKFGAYLFKTKLSEEKKRYYFKKLNSVYPLDDLKGLPFSELLEIGQVKMPDVKTFYQKQIEKLSTKNSNKFPLPKNALILFLGTPAIKETKVILKDLDLNFTKKITEEVTHLLIGKNAMPLPGIDDLDLPILTEVELKKHFESEKPKFIQSAVKEGNELIDENIKAMLLSGADENILVAFEMLKSGGITQKLLPALLSLAKLSENPKIVKTAKKFLLENAPNDWFELINDRKRFKQFWYKNDDEFAKKFSALNRISPIEPLCWLSVFVHKKFNSGLKFALYKNNKPSELRTAILKAMIKDLHFDYSRGMANKMYISNIRKKIKENYSLPIFPLDILEVEPELQSANFNNCYLTALPEEFILFKKLQRLDLGSNYLITLPDCFSEFKNLTELHLSRNHIEEFPKSFFELTSLKQLFLIKNKIDGKYKNPKNLKTLKAALSDCQFILK